MNKIKRELVEELYASTELYYQETERDRNSETTKNAFNIMFGICGEANDYLSKEDAGFLLAITDRFVWYKKSISRLLKCLEVCGIEVVE